MANELVTGTVIVRIDGRSIRSKEKATLEFGGSMRADEFADGQLIGYVAKPDSAKIVCTLAHTNATDLDALNNITDSTLIFECDSGPRYTVRGVFSTKPPKLAADGGGVEMEFHGQPAQQT